MRSFPLKIALALSILLLHSSAAFSQEPAHYTLDGDNILIETDSTDTRHLHAEGNVLLTYTTEENHWTLSADEVEFTENLPAIQLATAEGNIHLTGSDLTITAPGKMTLDLLEGWMKFDSTDIELSYPNGHLVTDSLEIREEIGTDDNATVVYTDIRTVAVYNLSTSEIMTGPASPDSSGSIFGSLRFDFSEITIETIQTQLTLIDGEPALLDCPDPTTITSSANTLEMPSCSLTFDPPTLHGNTGVELFIGEEINVSADFLTLTYPESGGMVVEFTGLSASDPENADAGQRVIISHPAGTFSADMITITVREDGTNRVHASGRASFEIPLGVFDQTFDDKK